jgi:RNA polymerase sigma factor (sigma-70 family)
MGVQHIEAVEDAVQSALLRALEHWKVAGLPDNPSAWLFKVAHNGLMDELRKGSGHRRILAKHTASDAESNEPPPPSFLAGEVDDDLLRMLFVCCDPDIPQDGQLVLALKTLCGFDTREIALRLFTSEANVYKRLARAREQLRSSPWNDEARKDEAPEQYASRRAALHNILYLLFTEGHLSSHATLGIRRELCDEAIRLTKILAAHPVGQEPKTFALLALMHLHAARLAGRQDGAGGLLLLEEQNRELWDREQIATGLSWLAKSARGSHFSRYHAEAGVAAEHCMAPSFEETRWEKVAECYELLDDSPMHRLNRAVAIAEFKGPEAGLALLQDSKPPTWLAGSYLWAAVLSDLHRRSGNQERAENYRSAALDLAPSEAVKRLLRRRLGGQALPKN